MDCTNFAAKTRLILLAFACFLYGSLRFQQIAPNSPQTINTSNLVHCFYCIFIAKVAHPPFSLEISKRFAADQRHFKDKIALLLQTCDKSCSSTLGPERKSCVSLETNDISTANLHYFCRRVTKVAISYWDLK